MKTPLRDDKSTLHVFTVCYKPRNSTALSRRVSSWAPSSI